MHLIDATKAFDRLNHANSLETKHQRGPHFPHKSFWYGDQSLYVRWVTLHPLLSLCVMESDWEAFCHRFSLIYVYERSINAAERQWDRVYSWEH